MTPRCDDCRHAIPVEKEDAITLQCRRYPPAVSIADESAWQSWPDMELDDWCGEYTPRKDRMTEIVRISEQLGLYDEGTA